MMSLFNRKSVAFPFLFSILAILFGSGLTGSEPKDPGLLYFGIAFFVPTAYGMLIEMNILPEASVTMYGRPAANKVGVLIFFLSFTFFLGYLLVATPPQWHVAYKIVIGCLFAVYAAISAYIIFFDKQGRFA